MYILYNLDPCSCPRCSQYNYSSLYKSSPRPSQMPTAQRNNTNEKEWPCSSHAFCAFISSSTYRRESAYETGSAKG